MKSQYEIVVPYYQQQESNEPQLQNAEDGHRYSMFVKGNDHMINGRTYCYKDEDGNYVSSFVSQYSDIIEQNLEPRVRDGVRALHEKGYLTFTSCQGHDDSKHRYIGVVFNTKEQKKDFIKNIDNLHCDIHWYDNAINTVERPCKEVPWWSDGGITLHIVYDDLLYHHAPQQRRRDKPYTDLDLTKFWNIQTNRNYNHYECVVLSFGYSMVEKSIWDRIYKWLFYKQNKVEDAYEEFITKAQYLPDYLA
jgi:hypothetical protein|tara:strand:- start:472 stop:1218 length:747 start_codon:yes stop_codon:yes gene_type:complete